MACCHISKVFIGLSFLPHHMLAFHHKNSLPDHPAGPISKMGDRWTGKILSGFRNNVNSTLFLLYVTISKPAADLRDAWKTSPWQVLVNPALDVGHDFFLAD
jgi:hypothetical protein